MKTWKHINLEQRKIISSEIAYNKKLIEIAEELCLDPRSISKEVRRNRIPVNAQNDAIPKYPLRYSDNCFKVKFKYDAKTANDKAEANLINSRKGIDLPYAVKMKKRKHNKKYDYSNNNIDRTGHTYLDYLSYIHKNPKVNL